MDLQTLNEANALAHSIEGCRQRLDFLTKVRDAIDDRYMPCEDLNFQTPFMYSGELDKAVDFMSMYIPKEDYLKAIDNLIAGLVALLNTKELELAKL
jgi:hypothetical protein